MHNKQKELLEDKPGGLRIGWGENRHPGDGGKKLVSIGNVCLVVEPDPTWGRVGTWLRL